MERGQLLYIFQIANNKGTDQTARMRRFHGMPLCCLHVTKSGFLASTGPLSPGTVPHKQILSNQFVINLPGLQAGS